MTTVEKIGLYLGMGVVLILLGIFVFSTHGVVDYRALKKQETLVNTMSELETRTNEKIEREINRLKYDLEYIRHMAKHEYGMAEPDELVFKKEFKHKEPSP